MHYFRKVDPKDPYATLEWGLFEQTVTVAGKTRRLLTYIPDGARPATAGVILLGPNHCSAEDFLANSGWCELADADDSREKLILFFLEPENGVWNTGEPYGAADGDVAYVNAVFAKCAERLHYCIHESKNYLYGVEQGGRIAQMAAMAEPALYAGLVTVGAGDVSDIYCSACRKDFCLNLNGFTDPEAKRGLRKVDIPMPVWIIDDPECGKAENALEYWIQANHTGKTAQPVAGNVLEYIRTEETEYPVNQDKRAYRIWKSEWSGASRNYGAACVNRSWKDFLSHHQRWMADPGGSLRLAKSPVRDIGMEYHFEEIGGWMREWYVYIPESVKQAPAKKVPLVFALHGYTCTGEIYAGNTNWYQVAQERGFIVVHPTAVPGTIDVESEASNPNNIPLPAWNFMNNLPGGPDEFLFFREMLARVNAEHPVDLTRVYATGHSHGSMMVQALAMGMPEMFAAVAPCSGVIFAPMYDDFIALPELAGDTPVPVWMFTGQEEQWLLDAEPTPENATGKTIALWHTRNRLQGKAEDRFQKHWSLHEKRWYDLCYDDKDGRPMLRYTQLEYFPHATMPEMSWRIWDEFFAHWSRTTDGLTFC